MSYCACRSSAANDRAECGQSHYLFIQEKICYQHIQILSQPSLQRNLQIVSSKTIILLLFTVVVYPSSTLTNWEASELLVMAKHRSTFGKDKIIGMAVVSGATLNDEANYNLNLGLTACLPLTDMGQAILNVLSSRTHFDELAKEFVALKTSKRCLMSDELEEMEQQQQQQEQKATSKSSSKSSGKSTKGKLLSGFLK